MRASDKRNEKGFTLIELIIVMAIIGIVISMAFSMNIFGIKVFAKGSDRYDLNTEANLASEYITKYIRFAYGVEILSASDTIPDSSHIAASTTPKDAYIYVGSDSGKKIIYYRDKNDTKALGQFDTCSLLVTPVESDKSLSFCITASVKAESYSVDSGIVPINLLIQNNPSIIDNTGTSDGVAMRIINDAPKPVSLGKLTFDPADAPDGTINVPYTGPYTLSASGGTAPYAYAVSASTRLPYGMTLSGAGSLSGTPIEAGTFSVGVHAYDSSTPSKSATNLFNITIKNNITIDSNAPVVSNVEIIGPASIGVDSTAAVGSNLSVYYIYIDAEDEPEGNTIYTWYRGTYKNGYDMTQITSGNMKEYTAVSEDVGKYLFVKVTPYSTDTTEGPGKDVFCMTPVKVTLGGTNAKPVVTDVTISGDANVGSTLTGGYIYSDADGDEEGNSVYRWYRSHDKFGADKELIAENIISKTYTLKTADKGYYIFFAVEPKAVSGASPGDVVMSSNIGKIQHNK